MCVCVYECVYECVYVCMCINMCVCVCMYVCMYVCTSVDLSIKWTALEVDSVVEWIRLLRGIDWYSTDRVT